MMEAQWANVDEFLSKLSGIPGRLLSVVGKSFDKASLDTVSYLRTDRLTGGTDQNRLAVRTGRLRSSVLAIKAKADDKTVVSGVQVGTVYSRIHINKRGTVTEIRPKRARFLAIPLPAALTAAGVPRGGPRDESVFGETFIRKGIIFGKSKYTKGAKTGELKNKITPLFVLKRSVKVKARIAVEDVFRIAEKRILEHLEKQNLNEAL